MSFDLNVLRHFKSHLKRIEKKTIAPFRRVGLNNLNFSIISNNCWGGCIYDKYGLPYLSPTIGLFFMPDDFLKFIKNLPYYLSLEINQVSFGSSYFKNKYQMIQDPNGRSFYRDHGSTVLIGRLDDVEVIFLHYSSFQDAKEKWNRRRGRVNFNNIVYKFNDQNGCTIQNFRDFQSFSAPNKLFFTSNPAFSGDNVIFCPKFIEEGYVVDDTAIKLPFNEKRFLNDVLKNRIF